MGDYRLGESEREKGSVVLFRHNCHYATSTFQLLLFLIFAISVTFRCDYVWMEKLIREQNDRRLQLVYDILYGVVTAHIFQFNACSWHACYC